MKIIYTLRASLFKQVLVNVCEKNGIPGLHLKSFTVAFLVFTFPGINYRGIEYALKRSKQGMNNKVLPEVLLQLRELGLIVAQGDKAYKYYCTPAGSSFIRQIEARLRTVRNRDFMPQVKKKKNNL